MDYRQLAKVYVCPDKCMVCGVILNQTSPYLLCPKCEEGLLEHHLCPKCGKPYHIEGKSCLGCEKQYEQIERVRGLFPYVDLYKESVLRWKYTGIRKYAKGYGALLADEVIKKYDLKVEGLIPVPIARGRHRLRGFNQALDLANVLGAILDVPVYDILERCKNTKPQSACKKEERAKNIRGAIRLKQEMQSQKPLCMALIDDIYTTGSTVIECMRVLEHTPIQTLYVLTVCIAI